MPAIERRPRLETSTQELDQAGRYWWDKHAPLIDRIWGLPDEICRDVRRAYLTQIRSLFHEQLGPQRLKILEIACGSGWPGRLLADETTHVTGVDFSKEQVRLAASKAKAENALYCEYREHDINQLPELFEGSQFDGALVHCGLHHLVTNELKIFTQNLTKVRPGFVVALVEPMYFDERSLPGKFLSRALDLGYKIFRTGILNRQAIDTDIAAGTDALLQESGKRGWFMSPKEMPFTKSEIQTLFEDKFHILRMEPVTYFGLRAGQDLSTLKDPHIARRLGARWIPFFNGIDRFLIGNGLLPRMAGEYLFTLIALVRK